MQMQYDMEQGCLIVFVPKELDHHEADKMRQEIDFYIDAYRVRHLMFDFSKTEFMDSSGIGVLIGRCRNMNFFGGDVKARHLNERVGKLFSVSGLSKIIPIEQEHSLEEEKA